MIKVTPSENLLPCKRDAWPIHRPYFDLIENQKLSQKLINIAFYLFLPEDDFIYSGHARKITRKDEEFATPDDVFYFQIWDGDDIYRTIGYRNFGYVGVMHMELPEGKAAKSFLNRDYIGEACKALQVHMNLPIGHAQSTIAYMQEGKLTLTFPHPGA